jgi:DNA-binding NarL/FixJ family response regulator
VGRDPSGTILVVDDDDGFRELLCVIFGEAGFATREAATGEEALAATRRDPPAAVVLDVRLPGVSGYAVCHELRQDFGEGLPILMVSGEKTEDVDRVAGLLLGADDFMTKPLAPDELLLRLRRLLRRSAPVAPAVASRLTPRELTVLRLLAEGLEQGEIAKRLSLQPKTVGTHIEHVLHKLGVHSRAQAVALAYRSDALLH